jgi:HK97 gp10 family phage protein
MIIPDPLNRRALNSAQNFSKSVNNGIREAFPDIGKKLKADARRSIRQPPKTGRIYRRRIRGRIRNHQASAPGQPPANMEGALQKTVDYKIKGDELEFGAGDQGDVQYAKYLEDGTKKMKPRKYLIRSILKNSKNTEKDFERHILRNFEKV